MRGHRGARGRQNHRPSNGTVTYVGKDIAYQLWKLGLLDQDFKYDLFDSSVNLGDNVLRRPVRSSALSAVATRSTTSSMCGSHTCKMSCARAC